MTTYSAKRRLFLSRLALTLSSASMVAGCAQAPVSEEQTWRSIVDTIIPRDEHPGALDLDLDAALLKMMNLNPNKFSHVSSLPANLDRLTKLSHSAQFAQLPLPEREQTLLTILYDGSVTNKRALLVVRAYILQWYYRSETGHKSIGYLPPNKYRVTRG